MARTARVVALLVANPALNSILSMVLAAAPNLRVRPFESLVALTTYMRLAPVDLVVTDFDRDDAPSALVARSLHEDPRIERPFQIIALAGHVSPDLKLAATSAGIDEVIVKPMSPRYLLERVQARLSRMPVRAAATHHAKLGGNVVPLFPNSPHQPSH